MSKNTVAGARSFVFVGLLADTGNAMRSPAPGTPPAQLPGVDHRLSMAPVHVTVAAEAREATAASNSAATSRERTGRFEEGMGHPRGLELAGAGDRHEPRSWSGVPERRPCTRPGLGESGMLRT